MPLNIPTKNTGDQLTASEFNELVNEAKNIETKLSGLSNYDDTALKNRIVAVESKIDSIAGSVVSFSESEVGTLKYAGKDYTIYERMVEITGLPSVAGESSEHVISDDPLGNNLYISVKDLIVKDSNGVYLPSNYTISKIHVTENFNTTLTMICDKGIATSATALVTLVYIKFEIEKIEFKIGNIDTIVNKENIKLSFPNLKYGKKFAYSFIFDDTTVKSNKAFFTINKKWIDNESFQHLNQTRTTGTIPAKTLGYTDGFGIEKRFTYGVAIWPGFGNQYIDNFMDPSQNPGKNYPYLVWSEVKTLTEFGNEFHFHDVKATDQKNVNEVLEGMKAAQKATIEKIGTGLKVMVRPNGNDTYVDAAMLFDDVVMSTTEGGQGIKYVINNDTDLKKGLIWRRNCDSLDSAGILSKIAEISTVDGTWWCDFSHSANQELLTAMAEINDTYGKEGNDSIWFASVDEVYEYWLVKKMSKFRIAILSDSEIKVTMFIPKISNGRHPDFTLHVSGLVGDNETISPLSDNIVGLNHGKINDVFSLNLNANVNLLNIVEKYTSKYEGLSLDEDKEDALYMVSQLRADLQTPFLARINAGDIAPILNSISLNSGATTTYEVAVSVLLNVTGNISHYRISESADLSAVAWIEGSSKTIKFNLSSSLGTKTVHVQVKNSFGESEVKTSSITLVERPAVKYRVTAQSNNASMGSVVPSTQEIAEGGEATVTATAASGHVIESWAGADQVTGVGESTGTAKVINVRSNKNITCNFKSSGGQQSGRKAIIAMGFPYAESGYDATYKINKIPNVSIARSFNDIDNVEFGSFINPGNPAGGFYPPNAQFYGKQTGDNRGVYPDFALKYNIWSYNKVDATCSLSVPQGVYNISLLLNADSSLSWGNSVPVVLNLVNITVGGIAKSPTLITNNTNTLLVFENINTTGEIVITINTGTTGTRVPLNVIEIEKIS